MGYGVCELFAYESIEDFAAADPGDGEISDRRWHVLNGLRMVTASLVWSVVVAVRDVLL